MQSIFRGGAYSGFANQVLAMMTANEDTSQRGDQMWPSFETASRVYDLANLAFVASLIVGVIATVLLVWMGNTKEGYLRRDVASAGERAASANERAAKLELEAEALRNDNLRIQRENAGRHLTDEQSAAISDTLRGKVSEVTLLWANNPEASSFAMNISFALGRAGVIVKTPQSGSKPVVFNLIDGNVGVAVYEPSSAPQPRDLLGGPVAKALSAGGIYPSGAGRPDFAMTWSDEPMIMVGSKSFFVLPGKAL